MNVTKAYKTRRKMLTVDNTYLFQTGQSGPATATNETTLSTPDVAELTKVNGK